jgi:hypothetical protein
MLAFAPQINEIARTCPFDAFPASILNNARNVGKTGIIASAGAVAHWRLAVLIGFIV